MKKIITTAAVMLAIINANAQTMYKMESPLIYDEDGNQYQMRNVLDHLPTKQDSIEFEKAVKDYCKQINKNRNLRLGIKQYEAIVSEIRIDKDGNKVFKPIEKYKSEWYRYYGNVKVGDVITITKEDAIEPKF